ncbi:5'/3'-nucleotidase SurE [Zhouia sp. PK063]|uniref:5'/3'-nucleotidase SurE n=1 Tax=Zhouia sp. PK063 TaxID=3373602 RepID=UPI0037AFAC1A
MKLFLLLICYALSLYSYAHHPSIKFNHIVITNDNGIKDAKRLMALAQKVKPYATQVSIVVSDKDRSGYTNFSSIGKNNTSLTVTCKQYDEKTHIALYTTSGTPADNVLVAILGLFADNVPDLILSGINGGPNTGASWFQSGTIGAVRMAAYLGVKAVSFSGFNRHQESAFEKIPAWIAKFITSPAVSKMAHGQYITVAFPDVAFKDYKGIQLIDRAITYNNPVALAGFKNSEETNPHQSGNSSHWKLQYLKKPKAHQPKKDIEYIKEGYIVISAMTIDENEPSLQKELKLIQNQIPPFE